MSIVTSQSMREMIIYRGIEFSAKPSDSYNPETAANKLVEFLELLYQQMPYDVAQRLKKTQELIILEDVCRIGYNTIFSFFLLIHQLTFPYI